MQNFASSDQIMPGVVPELNDAAALILLYREPYHKDGKEGPSTWIIPREFLERRLIIIRGDIFRKSAYHACPGDPKSAITGIFKV